MFPLTLLHLRFVLEARTLVRLSGYNAGSQLRGALGNVMRRAYCAEAHRTNGRTPLPNHAAACPVCWLLAANEHPGEERRGYALIPPLNPPEACAPGERFSFGLTLFGSALRFLPYFVLAVPETGREGAGTGRGQFALRQVWAADPLSGDHQPVLAEGESLVHSPTRAMVHAQVLAAANQLGERLNGRGNALITLNFLTPMRLIEDRQLLKVPDFGVLFKRLLRHLDDVARQHCEGTRRAEDEVNALQALADRVQLMEAQTRWVDVWSGSTRRGTATPMGGFVGKATYSAPVEVWRPLLPWLLWGQATQVGKDTVKGNGVYEVIAPGLRRYASWVEG